MVADMLKDITFFKEIIVTKEIEYEDAEWLRQKKADPNATPLDKDGNRIPHRHSLKRDERIIVTYSHDFALYLKHKRGGPQENIRSDCKVKEEKNAPVPTVSDEICKSYILYQKR